jgi:aminocarboxymuconate-semialdehyde decarboxylase
VITDYQAHWYPRSYLEALCRRTGAPRAEPAEPGYLFHPRPGDVTARVREIYFDLDLHLEDAAANGVDTIVSSPAFMGDVAAFEASEARELSLLLNEEYARAEREHPHRFVGLATLPLQDAAAAIEVLDDAAGRLGLRGVVVHSNIDGRAICGEETWPVYARIEELGLPIVLHPTRSVGAAAYDPWGRAVDLSVGWMYDTAAAAYALIVSGTLDAFPKLVVLHPHLGGMLPFIAGRLRETEPYIKSAAAEPAHWYFRNRFWIDSVSADPGSLALAVEVYGIDRMVFGADVPYLGREAALAFVRDNLDSEQARTVFANRLPFPEPGGR